MSEETSTEWQLDRRAAELYQTVLVPAILGPAADALVEAAQPTWGEHMLDVGCGTGSGCRTAASAVGEDGRVVGVDVNAGMLEVARSLPLPAGRPIEWRDGDALALPFADDTFDLVVSSQTLQFLLDRESALTEMLRVLRPGGRLALSVWSSIDQNPYFHALVAAMAEHVGAGVARGLEAAFGLADLDLVSRLVRGSGFSDVRTDTTKIHLTLSPMVDFVPEHIAATPMSVGYLATPPERREAVIGTMDEAMAAFSSESGVTVPFEIHITTARGST